MKKIMYLSSYYWTFLFCPQTYKVSKNLIGLDFRKCPVVWGKTHMFLSKKFKHSLSCFRDLLVRLIDLLKFFLGMADRVC